MQVNFTINIDDRLVKGIKAFFKKKSVIVTTAILLITTISFLYAQTATRREFAAGNIIKSADLNYNFKYLWDNISGKSLPIGTIVPYAGTTTPDGWLLCNGASIPSDSEYDDLRAVLNASTVPDLQGRVVAGLNDMGGSTTNRLPSWADSMRGTPGTEERHELTLQYDDLPPHYHCYTGVSTFQYGTDPLLIDFISIWASAAGSTTVNIYEPNAAKGNETFYQADNLDNSDPADDAGAVHTHEPLNNPVSIVQPTIALKWIIKAE